MGIRAYAIGLICAGCLGLALFLYSLAVTQETYDVVEQNWRVYSGSMLESQALHDRLRGEIGYTGFIHNFKSPNYKV